MGNYYIGDETMLNIYEMKRQQVRELIDKEDYKLALTVCFQFERILKKAFEIIDRDDLWHVYYKIALIYSKLKKFKLMKKFADKSSIFCQESYQEIYSSWLIANYYMYNDSDNRQNLALKRFDRIQFYFEKTGNQLYYISQIMINRAFILKDINLTLKAIDILKKVAPDDLKELDVFYESLIRVYLYHEIFNQAKYIMSLLNNKTIKNKFSQQLLSNCKVA